MGKLLQYTMQETEEWEKIVQSFLHYDVYYLPSYVKAFEENGDGTPLLLYYKDKNLKAINVCMKRPVPGEKEGYFDLITPYGYGGFLLETAQGADVLEEKKKLLEAYRGFCEREQIVAEFVRFHPILQNAHVVEDMYPVEDLGPTIKMDVSSKETIWQNMSSKNRNMIRKAEKNGVKVFWGRSEELFDTFEQIYNATMDKVNAKSYYYFEKNFYQSILFDLKEQAMIFYAKKEEEIIAMSIIMFCNGAMHYHLSASKKEYQTFAPTNLILYEAALFGAAQGYKTFHLGGGLGSGKDHLYSFKKNFNRNEDCTFSVGRKIWNQEIYDKLCQENKVDPETKFFPAYRDL